MHLPQQIQQAQARIGPYLLPTPLWHSPPLSRATGAEVWLKLENLQPTGSFKVRGALNKLLSIAPEALAKGIVTASSGNHGAATAWGLSKLKARGTVFVPNQASSSKVEAIRRHGAEVHFYGDDGAITEVYARQYAGERKLVYISPYNDLEVVAGQGTIGVELEAQGHFDAVIAAVGGGGLISGIAAYLKPLMPVQMIGASPANDAAMFASLEANKIVEAEARPTLSDGTAGGLEPGSITFELCRQFLDRRVYVSEQEIAGAMRDFIQTHRLLIEGAAGVALAALVKQAEELKGRRVVVIVCGANISAEVLESVL